MALYSPHHLHPAEPSTRFLAFFLESSLFPSTSVHLPVHTHRTRESFFSFSFSSHSLLLFHFYFPPRLFFALSSCPFFLPRPDRPPSSFLDILPCLISLFSLTHTGSAFNCHSFCSRLPPFHVSVQHIRIHSLSSHSFLHSFLAPSSISPILLPCSPFLSDSVSRVILLEMRLIPATI